MIAAIIGLLEAGLQIWELKERRKYIDELKSLKETWYAEFNKPYEQRDNAVLDNTEHQLQLLIDAVRTDLATKNAGNLPNDSGT